MTLDAPTREQIRHRRDEARRRALGAEVDEEGRTTVQGSSHGHQALALTAWEAPDGDPLGALAFALDVLEGRRAVT